MSTPYLQALKESCDKSTTPLRAIRQQCLRCVSGNPNHVKECTEENRCTLWKYRLGKNPNKKKRVLTEEQREVIRQRFKLKNPFIQREKSSKNKRS